MLRSSLLGVPSSVKNSHIPYVTFTEPELAQVGVTEEVARIKFGDKLVVSRFSYDQIDRAIAERSTEGIIKILIYNGRVVGVSIIGRQAGELINFWTFVIANGVKLSKIAQMVAAYPTLGEINKRVVGNYYAPRLFESERIKRLVRFVQKWVP